MPLLDVETERKLIVAVESLRTDRSGPRHKHGTPEYYRQEGELNMLDAFLRMLRSGSWE